jgi:hypothetical protein
MLRYMREQVLAKLKSLDVGLTPEDIRWCITVPAIWSDGQKLLMRQTAEEAGLDAADQVVVAIEPETAAPYGILDARRRNSSEALQGSESQRFMVVDCGGGTIDISAFSGSMTDGRLQLAEIAPRGRHARAARSRRHDHRRHAPVRLPAADSRRRMAGRTRCPASALADERRRQQDDPTVEAPAEGADGDERSTDTGPCSTRAATRRSSPS